MISAEENILLVSELEPRLKHATIFSRFDELADETSMVIHNDHDPKPLYYQMLGERGETFVWEYLEQGPDVWKVRISKRLSGVKQATVGETAAKDLRKAKVFKKYGLDFCCGGKKTIAQACTEKGVDITALEYDLQQTEKISGSRELPYNHWSLDFLADYIVNTHHTYVSNSLPELMQTANKVYRVHGQEHPELLMIYNHVEAINAELTEHMMKEENILFPYIRAMVQSGKDAAPAHFGSVQNPISMMEAEHESAGQLMKEIREVTNNYTLPEDACGSFRFLYGLLEEFEEDLHLHIHLENNLLFPKALQLEAERN